MENNQYIVALEIGSTKIVGAIAEKSSAGYLSVNHLEEQKISNCVRLGSVGNVENTKQVINSILYKLANSMGAQANDISDVFVGISGRSMHSVKTEVERNLDPSVQITRETVNSLIKSAAAEPMGDFETIALVPRKFYVDHEETNEPVGRYGSSINIVLNRIVIRKNVKLNLERAMGALRVGKYIVTPLATAYSVLNDEERDLGVMLVDMGAETTEVAIYKANALVYLATLPLGGHNITKDLMNGLGITEEKAERIKKSLVDPLNNEGERITIDGVDSKQATNYIIPRNGEIIANINKQIEYAGLKREDVKSIVLLGGGARLKGIRDKFEDLTHIPTRMASFPPMLNIINHDINRAEYIEIFSLLVKASEMAPEGFSSIQIRKPFVEDGPVMEQPVEQPTTTPEPTRHRGQRGGGVFTNIMNRFGKLFEENDTDDEKDDE